MVRETAPALVISGNHDVPWWELRSPPSRATSSPRNPPLLRGRVVAHPPLSPARWSPRPTSHGITSGSLTPRLRDWRSKGTSPARVHAGQSALFSHRSGRCPRAGRPSRRAARGRLPAHRARACRPAQQGVLDSGADVVLSGRDHQGRRHLGGRWSCPPPGPLSARSRAGRPSCFDFVTIEPTAVQITLLPLGPGRGRFRASDSFAFAWGGAAPEARRDSVRPCRNPGLMPAASEHSPPGFVETLPVA